MGLPEEILFDVHAPALTGPQRKLVDIVTKTAIGGVIVWTSVVELSAELATYRKTRKV